MEPLIRFEATITDIVPIGLVPEGMRLDIHLEGQATAGMLAGARVRGIDYLLIRADGVGVIDAYEVLDAGERRFVSAHAQGYSIPPEGMEAPTPDELLSPDFVWPDAPIPIHGFALYRTGASDLAHLNRTIASFRGHVNPGRSELFVEAHEFASEPVSAG